MADFLQAIGRTNSLRAVTGDIVNQAQNMRQEARLEQESQSNLANAALARQQATEEYQRKNKPIPMDMIREAFPIPEVAGYAEKLARAMGKVEDIEGVPTIRAGSAREVYDILKSGDNPQVISSLTTQHYRGKVGQLREQFAELQQSGKADGKEAAALEQSLKQAQQGLITSLEQADKLKTYTGLLKEGYAPAEIQKAMETGDMSLLGERRGSKNIERTIDLGNKQRVIYTDGRVEDIPKGVSPSTIVMAGGKSASDEMKMRKEFQDLPEVKTYPVIESQAMRLDKAMAEAKKGGSLVAVDQALITILNKMLDPSSVVRESEYARTPQDMAVLNRIKGKFEKIKSGGAGMTAEERDSIYNMAQQFKAVAEEQYRAQVDYYSDLSKRYGYRPENIVRLGGKKTTDKTTNATRTIEVKNPKTGALETWDLDKEQRVK